MRLSIIIEGPQGSGKTLAAEALCKHYGLSEIWDEADHDWRKTVPTTGALILTECAGTLRGAIGLQVIQVADAFKAAGITLEGLKAQRARKPQAQPLRSDGTRLYSTDGGRYQERGSDEQG